ncbi:MAG TPA: prepilin-type N-terminal cleavage/methylation domain-containing protein [Vicinamibacterales bacterium]|nr:prepilin-type N-terminal cleavage/methylation domain-containing protein [Vicinamibacterales bacterium]
MSKLHNDSGFSLIELLVSMAVLLIVSSIVTTALLQMTHSQTTIWNRTEMHSGIRGATELLQQEVGQAGRLSTPTPVRLTEPVGAATSCDAANPTLNAVEVGVTSIDGLFATSGVNEAYELMTTMDGDSQETVKLAALNSAGPKITACFTKAHADDTLLMPMGAFATGVIPPTGVVNGSSASVLKLYGDINGDGNMVYVEYRCDTAAHNLYRNVMAFDAASKPAVTDSEILLSNIIDNPGGTPCFTYQTTSMIVQGTPFTFVLDVAVTLTVQTEQLDPVTKQYQTETKALLNVSPRNVYNAWMLAGMGYTDRIQSTPTSITALLP